MRRPVPDGNGRFTAKRKSCLTHEPYVVARKAISRIIHWWFVKVIDSELILVFASFRRVGGVVSRRARSRLATPVRTPRGRRAARHLPALGCNRSFPWCRRR